MNKVTIELVSWICFILGALTTPSLAGEIERSLYIDVGLNAYGAQGPYQPGRIFLEIRTTNVSFHDIRYSFRLDEGGRAELSYFIKVWHADGSEVPLTTRGKAVYSYTDEAYDTVGATSVTLHPQASSLAGSWLTDIYDMSEPGRYFVQVWGKESIGARLKSNLLEVSVP